LPSKIWQTLGDALIRVSFDVICSWFRISSCPYQKWRWFVSPCLLLVTKATLVCESSSLAHSNATWLRQSSSLVHYWTEAEYKKSIYSIFGRIYYKQDSNSTTSHIFQKGLKFHQNIASFILQNGFHFHQ
jgi:hypothetical protein